MPPRRPKRSTDTNPSADVTPSSTRSTTTTASTVRPLRSWVRSDPLVTAVGWTSTADSQESLPRVPPLVAMILHLVHVATNVECFNGITPSGALRTPPSWVRQVRFQSSINCEKLAAKAPRLHRLKFLDTASTTPFDFRVFKYLTHLQVSKPTNRAGQPVPFNHIFSFASQLRSLIISDTRFLLSTLDGIDELRFLEALELHHCCNDLRSVAVLGRAPSLRTLTMRLAYALMDLQGLEQSRTLETLVLEYCSVGDVTNLSNAPRLTKLAVHSLVYIRGIDQLTKCPVLSDVRLDFPELQLLNQCPPFIEGCRTLTALDVSLDNFPFLGEWPFSQPLESLTVKRSSIRSSGSLELANTCCRRVKLTVIPFSCSAAASNNRYLEELTISRAVGAVTPLLPSIMQLPALRVLDIYLGDITHVRWLKGNTTLTSLKIGGSNTQRQSIDLSAIRDAPSLKNVTIQDLDVSGDGNLHTLCGLHSLQLLAGPRYEHDQFPFLDVSALSDASEMTSLLISYPCVINSLPALASLPCLRHLRLLSFEMEDFSFVYDMVNLEGVELQPAPLVREKYDALLRYVRGDNYRLLPIL